MQIVRIPVVKGDTDWPRWKLAVRLCLYQILKRNWVGDRFENLQVLNEMSRTDAKGPRVNVGLGHPMVDQNHRLLVEGRTQPVNASRGFLKRASERDVLRNVDWLFLAPAILLGS